MPRRESSSPTPARTQRTAALPAYEPPILPLHTGAIETLSTTVPRLYNSPAEYVVSALHELTSSVGENMPQALLDSLENAARGVVDASAKLEGSRNVLAAIVAQERARGTWDMDDEDLEAEAVRVEEGVWGRFKKGFQKEMTAYAAHDGYKNFRHTLWDVQHPDRPVPSERHWFPEERGPGDEETDDEVEVARGSFEL
ncbi:hypothetical protein FN846DRAFT_907813 [Sphaerosporella brunnea]|uniref:Uncharacterized protein n=1 Tax=Sphaerosporella brunnea TaxID=1250544 RepID=A0A5J5EUQ1_9PEZI|nr:hypothetical protein FN846DRAFT_907813 [Sphaerosporella brunnea]